jgi:hypothetical protein
MMISMKIRAYFPLIPIATIAVFLRLIMIPMLGNGVHGNPVDIYYVDVEAAKLLLHFRDPYLFSSYTNHYGAVVTFAYLPLIPAYFAPFVLLGSDIRYGSILADVVIAIALYFIGRSLLGQKYSGSWISFSGSIVFAIMPLSIYLTSVTGSNQMIGPMFLIIALAALLEGVWLVAGIFLGLALASNQFILLVFPVILIYCLRNRDLRTVFISILVACAIVVPFLIHSPSKFLYDVVLFQFQRPVQHNGIWSLYGLVYAISGFQIRTYWRAAIFLVTAGIATYMFSNSKRNILIGIALVSGLASIVLPIDGFWNYFLFPITMVCALVPLILLEAKVK